jgi:hypothetical protein
MRLKTKLCKKCGKPFDVVVSKDRRHSTKYNRYCNVCRYACSVAARERARQNEKKRKMMLMTEEINRGEVSGPGGNSQASS